MEVNGVKLREIREDQAYSQRELAKRAGVAADTVYRLERSEKTQAHPRTIRKLAEALGVEPRELRPKREG
jgi:transcriptional regulator with XRE-family HTH domain